MENKTSSFVWDPLKELINIRKHGIDFTTAARVFKDPKRKIFIDSKHSKSERDTFVWGELEVEY